MDVKHIRNSFCCLLLALLCFHTQAGDRDLKIFLLLGQSNMEGQAFAYTNATTGANVPTIEFLLSGSPAATSYLANMPHRFKDSLEPDWLDPRSDVWCLHVDSSTGNDKSVLPTRDPSGLVTGIQPLSPGFGVSTGNGSMFGAELAMGIRLGNAVAAPVFLFKSDKGGTSLAHDWRPPDAVAARGGSLGINYRNTIDRFISFLDTLDADLADNGVLDAYLNAPGYEVSGVLWLQGWNEQFGDGPYTAAQMQAEYASNLKDLIHSIRDEDPRIPSALPLIIAESSDQNATLNAGRESAVDDLNTEIPHSAVYYDTDDMIGVDWGADDDGVPFTAAGGYHFHARAENFLEIGWKAAGAVLEKGFITQAPTYYNSKVREGRTHAGVILGVTGIEVTIDDFVVTVDDTEPGSPSVGVVLPGDLIRSVNGVLLGDDSDPRIPLGQQIGASEAFDGNLVVGLLRSGTVTNVTITLPVLGAYTDTWPLLCPKSSNVVDSVAQHVINSTELDSNGATTMFAGLFLLSTGEDQYLPDVERQVNRILAGGLPGGHECWGIGYQLLFLGEYYLRTGDTNVLPRIQDICDYAATGDVEGLFGHGLTPGSGYVAGGIMNQPGNIIYMGMTLARECGVNVPPSVWIRGMDYLFRYAGHGPVPYGDHRSERFPNTNGKDGSAACVWSLLEGSAFQSAASYTALAVADSYPFVENGHTGGGFDVIWRALAAVHVSPAREANHRNMLDRLTWYYDLCRRHDGGFRMLTTGDSRYTSDDYGMGAAMVYTASRKALRITGAPPSVHSVSYPAHPVTWGNDRDRIFLSDTAVSTYGNEDQRADAVWENLHNPDGLPASYFGRLLYHYNSTIREAAAITLGLRADEDSIAELKAALQHSDPRPRRAALEGLAGYEGWSRPMNDTAIPSETISAEFVTDIQNVIDDPSSALWEIDGALLALSRAEPEDVRDRLDVIQQYMTHDDWWLRESAFWAAVGLGETIRGNEFQLLADMFHAEDRVYASGSYHNGFKVLLNTLGIELPDADRVSAIQAIGRSLHKPKYLEGYRDGPYNKAHRTMMLLEEFDQIDLILDIADDVAQYFNLWEIEDAGNSKAQVQSNPTYHRGFYGYADQMGAAGDFIIHAMKRMRDAVSAAIAGGDTSSGLQEYYEAITNSVTLYENDYGVVTPHPGLAPLAAAATAEIVGGWGRSAELLLDGSASSDPDGVLFDYVWEANDELVARGATATGFAEIVALSNLTLRVTDDQAHQDEVLVSVVTNPLATTYGLLGYWPMDLTSGTEITDFSAFLNHGAVVEGAPEWKPGKFGNALEISRLRDDRASIPHHANYNENGAYTLSLWFQSIDGLDQLNQFSKGEGLVSISGVGSNATADAFGSPWTAADLGFNMDDGLWHHIVFTFDADAATAKHLYVDGTLVATGGSDGAADDALNTSPIYFGSSDDAEKSTVLFDDVAVWGRVISSAEISTLYNGGAGNVVTDRSLAPARPQNVVAIASNQAVIVNWSANTEDPDLRGVHIYRSTSAGGPYSLISGEWTRTGYIDSNVVNYTAYFYVVRSVNTRGLESGNSREVTAVPFVPLKTILAAGLVGYWPMDSLGGTNLIDVTANQNDGAFLQGNPAWVPGKFGNALDIVSQREDWAQIPHHPDYITNGAYSISLWIYPVDCYRNQNIFTKGENKVGIRSIDREMTWQSFGSPWTASSLEFQHNSREWEHVVIIYDSAAGLAKQVYANGVLVGSNATTGVGADIALNTDPIGFSVENLYSASSARFDDLAYWNRALTVEEVAYLYNNGDGNTVSDLNEGPPVPTGLTATGSTQTVVLEWDQAASNVMATHVLRSFGAGGPYSLLSTIQGSRFVDTGLTNGTPSYYVVQSVDLAGNESAPSMEVSAVPTDDATAPAAPAGLVAFGGFSRAYLDWDDQVEADVTEYNVYRANDMLGPFALMGTTGGNSEFIDEGAANGVLYYYQITAVDLAGNESLPAQINVTPLAEQDLETGLVGYWPLDAGTGTNVTDVSTNLNDGSFTSGSPDWVVGKFGNALQFVEADQESALIDGLPVYRSENTFTLSFWINQKSGYRNRPIDSAGIRIHDYGASFGELWPRIELGFSNDQIWHHLAFVFDASDPDHGKKLYVDGVLIASNVAYLADTLLNDSWISLGIDHGSYRWGGILDEVAVWNRALSQDDVESMVFINGGAGRPIRPVGQTPPVADSQEASTDEDTPLLITLTADDGQGDPLTFSIVDPPTNGVLSLNFPFVTYTPTNDFNGVDRFTFKVNDTLDDSIPAAVDLTVNPVNDPPVADPQVHTINEDEPLALNLTALDVDLDPLTYTVLASPTNGVLSGNLPNLTYTPITNSYGSDHFTFLANDGLVDSGIATVSITIDSVNDVPAAVPLDLYLLQNAPVEVWLDGSDQDLHPLTFTVQTTPTNGTLSGVAPDLVYTPATNFIGSDRFTYVVNDGFADSPPATVTLTVVDPVDAKDLLARGLIGYWPMNNVTGSVMTDESALQNHGSFVDGTPGWVPGKFGNALDLILYRHDRALIPHIPEYNASGAYTMSFWFYPISCYRDNGIFNKGEGRIALGANGSDIYWQKFGTPWTSTDLGFNGNAQEWHHLVAVYDPAATPARKVYLNSVLVVSNEAAVTDLDDVLNEWPISFNPSAGHYKATVRFDDVAYWNRGITKGEIDYLHNGGTGNTVSDLNAGPSSPDVLAAIPSTGSVLLSWSLPDDDVETSMVYRATAPGGPFTLVANTDVTTYADTGLTNGVTVYYYLRCADVQGVLSTNSVTVSATPFEDLAPPAGPANLVSDGGFRRVYLEWTASTEPDLFGYNVARSLSAGGPFAGIATNLTDASYVDEGLVNDVTYYYRVTATDFAGNESAASTVSDYPRELQNVTLGLVGYWPLDSTNGTTLVDFTDQGNDGYFNSGTPDWLAGKFGNALNLVEAEQESARIDAIPEYRSSGAYSISMWVLQRDGYRNRFFYTGDLLFYDFKLSNFGAPWSSASLGFADDELWHHVALTFDGRDPVAGKKLYVDGVLIASDQAYPVDDTLDDSPYYLGINHGTYRWGGLLDDLAVWNRALSKDEVETLALSNGGAGASVADQLFKDFDLSLQKTANTTSLWGHVDLTYLITVTNSGTDVAEGVQVVDALPANLDFVSSTPAPTATNGNAYSFNLGNLPAGAATSVIIQAVPSVDMPALIITNTAVVSSSDEESVETNNSSSAWTVMPDVDLDGVIDWLEANVYGSNPASSDSDGDGMRDGDEIFAGTDLTNRVSLLEIGTMAVQQGTNLLVEWQSVPGKTYDVQISTNQLSGWISLQNGIVADPPTNSVTLPVTAEGVWFHRVIVE